jgi:HEPN domain-containing protein
LLLLLYTIFRYALSGREVYHIIVRFPQGNDHLPFKAGGNPGKVLKAFLTHNGAGFPPTHNLAKLVRSCEQLDESFAELISVVEPLTPYVVELRYEGDFWPSEEVARDARADAEAVRDFVLAKLPEEITKGIG